MRSKRQRPELPDVAAPDLSAFRSQDDISIARLVNSLHPPPSVLLELENRRRFEVCWSGAYVSGPDLEVPPPVKSGYRQFL